MAQPRIRDFFTHLTTLPSATLIAVCLFLPHTKDCNTKRLETPFEADTWFAILPLVALGVLPLAWHASAAVRREAPEIVLSFTGIMLSIFVITMPIAIALVWSYSKRTLRGEMLVAVCSAACVVVWLVLYPVITLFDTWLPAAIATWFAAIAMLAGFVVWASAAAARAKNVDDNRPLHVAKLTGFAAFAPLATRVSRSCGDGTTRAA